MKTEKKLLTYFVIFFCMGIIFLCGPFFYSHVLSDNSLSRTLNTSVVKSDEINEESNDNYSSLLSDNTISQTESSPDNNRGNETDRISKENLISAIKEKRYDEALVWLEMMFNTNGMETTDNVFGVFWTYHILTLKGDLEESVRFLDKVYVKNERDPIFLLTCSKFRCHSELFEAALVLCKY